MSLAPIRSPAFVIFGAFLASIFLFNGGPANAVASICFVAAWALIIKEAREGTLVIPHIAPVFLIFLAAMCVRLLLPPTGAADAIPGPAVSRGLLIMGFFGLTLYVYARLRFDIILWMIAGMASATTLVAIAVFLHQMPADHRLLLLGRAAHPILGAGAIATGAIAAISLLAYHVSARRGLITTVTLLFAISAIVVGLYFTGSRGPLLSLVLAAIALPIVMLSGSRALLFVCAFGAWALVTGIILFDEQIRSVLCPMIELACRSPNRQDAWAASFAAIAQHPLWGNGYAFRLSGVPHAHNTYFGVTLHYGIPMGILFIGVMAAALSSAARLRQVDEKCFVVGMLIFVNGFMGSDLSDPMRFFNTHYLFLWFPLVLAFIAEESREAPDDSAKHLERAS
jgi:O-antigen ligase